MTDHHPFSPETQSIQQGSDPQEIARRLAEQRGVLAEKPDRIGSYKILEVLGEGGMGIVYLAEQEKPIHRRVALKIIKLGMDTKQVIARFEAEREALALMNHPNVARVFDAGATEQGRPYFAMEYVEGQPITKFCDGHRLSITDRLELFMQVCQAVQHAHQKGIIHRDLKPSNVLVSEVDGQPSAKVIDFGIAKATQQKLTEVTMFTEQGVLVGTPAYMSPEQADPLCQDIDTRSDIYSLGVILYELLVGALPFDPDSLRQASLAEMQRIIREVDPPKPSTKLFELGDLSTTVAEHRQVARSTLVKQIRGDLDWIVMKCLEKDRGRRYETANALVMEIQRYLHNEPILAGPPSRVYRMKKFARRNRGFLAATAAVVLTLTAGLIGTALMYIRALHERDRAQEAERLTQESLEQTQEARDESEQVTQFLSDMLAAVDPGQQGKDVTVREVLDKSAEAIGEKFSGKPLLEARLRFTVGRTYHGLGLFEPAEQHLAEAAVIYTRDLGLRDQRTLQAANAHASVIHEQGKYGQSEAALRSTLEIQRRVLGEEHPETLYSVNNLANSLHGQGRYVEAEELQRKTLEIQRRVLGEGHPGVLLSMNNLANSLYNQGRYAEAEELCRKTLEIQRRVRGEEHPETLVTMNSLASSLYDQGRHAEAEELRRRILDIHRRVLGEEHPSTLMTMNNLANNLFEQGRYTDAEELYHRTLEIQRRVLGEEHPNTLASINNLANCAHFQGRLSKAEELHRKTQEIQRRVLGEEHPNTLQSMSNLATSLHDQGRYAEAEKLYRQTLEIRRRVLGRDHPNNALTLHGLAAVLEKTGELTEAEELCREADEILTSRLPTEHRFRKANANLLGGIFCGLGRYSEAEPLLIESYEALRDNPAVLPHDQKDMVERLVRLYEAWDAADPGKGYAEKAAEYRKLIASGQPASTAIHPND